MIEYAASGIFWIQLRVNPLPPLRATQHISRKNLGNLIRMDLLVRTRPSEWRLSIRILDPFGFRQFLHFRFRQIRRENGGTLSSSFGATQASSDTLELRY